MAAYLIFDVEVTDPAERDDYAKLANESLVTLPVEDITSWRYGRGIGGRLETRDVGNAGI